MLFLKGWRHVERTLPPKAEVYHLRERSSPRLRQSDQLAASVRVSRLKTLKHHPSFHAASWKRKIVLHQLLHLTWRWWGNHSDKEVAMIGRRASRWHIWVLVTIGFPTGLPIRSFLFVDRIWWRCIDIVTVILCLNILSVKHIICHHAGSTKPACLSSICFRLHSAEPYQMSSSTPFSMKFYGIEWKIYSDLEDSIRSSCNSISFRISRWSHNTWKQYSCTSCQCKCMCSGAEFIKSHMSRYLYSHLIHQSRIWRSIRSNEIKEMHDYPSSRKWKQQLGK